VAPQEPGVTPTATATPTPTDSGAPNPTATLPPITAPITAFAGVKGPLAQKILKDEADVEALGQQLQALQQSVDTDAVWTTQAFARWQAAVVVLSQAQNATTDAATKAYENLYALGPFGDYSTDIQQLSLVAPGLVKSPITDNGEADQQQSAQDEETIAFNAYLSALSAQQSLQTQLDQ